jgi:hypothetical protein
METENNQRQIRALVVEDDPCARNIIRGATRPYADNVDYATNVQGGLDLVRTSLEQDRH